MKRLLLRIGLFIFTFAVGFSLAPIRFIGEEVGSGSVGPGSFCSFSVYSSTQLERTSSWSCSFEDDSSRNQFIDRIKAEGKMISTSEERMLVECDSPEHGYCSHWIDQRRVIFSCSKSLRHITE